MGALCDPGRTEPSGNDFRCFEPIEYRAVKSCYAGTDFGPITTLEMTISSPSSKHVGIRSTTIAGLWLAVWLVLPMGSALGAEHWLTGAALRQQFRAPVAQVQWHGTPLRKALRSLSGSQRVAILLDRRVDPDQALDLRLDGLPLGDVLVRIAESAGLAAAPIGSIVYFGPADEVPKLETALEVCRREARQLSDEARRRWLESRALSWDDLAVPRDLLARLAEENHVELAGLDRVPHDLWAAADLPAMTLIDRIGLIAGQFGLMVRFDGSDGRASLVPIPDDVAVVETYAGGRQPEELLRRWAELIPGSRLELVGGKVSVRGLLRDHRKIAASQNPSRESKSEETARAPSGAKRYTLNQARGTLGYLIEELSRRLGLKLKMDREAMEKAGISLTQPVVLSVREATREGLFRALLEPVGCTFRLEGQTLEVQPKPAVTR